MAKQIYFSVPSELIVSYCTNLNAVDYNNEIDNRLCDLCDSIWQGCFYASHISRFRYAFLFRIPRRYPLNRDIILYKGQLLFHYFTALSRCRRAKIFLRYNRVRH